MDASGDEIRQAESIGLFVLHCKKVETRLKDEFGATGRGLHELITSVEAKLPPDMCRTMRFVASVRNDLVHNANIAATVGRASFRTEQ